METLYDKILKVLDERIQSGHDDAEQAAKACESITKDFTEKFLNWIDMYCTWDNVNQQWKIVNTKGRFTHKELIEEYIKVTI